MGINALTRCTSCNMLIRKMELKEGLCPKCSENKDLIKRVSMLEEYYGVTKEDYFGDGTWHTVTEEEANLIKKQARIFCGDGKIDKT